MCLCRSWGVNLSLPICIGSREESLETWEGFETFTLGSNESTGLKGLLCDLSLNR